MTCINTEVLFLCNNQTGYFMASRTSYRSHFQPFTQRRGPSMVSWVQWCGMKCEECQVPCFYERYGPPLRPQWGWNGWLTDTQQAVPPPPIPAKVHHCMARNQGMLSSIETKMLSFWRNFHHWLHRKLSFLFQWVHIPAVLPSTAHHQLNFDELVQERRNSSALAMELSLSCTDQLTFKY